VIRVATWKDRLLTSLLAVLAGLAVSGLYIAFTGNSPLKAYAELFKAGFGFESLKRSGLFQSFQLATSLILTGLAAVVAMKSGIFSIGQEGQYLMGATVAAWLGASMHLPYVIHPIAVIACSMVAGAIYSFIPGWLKVKLNVNEIITTFLMNSMAVLLMTYIVNFPLRADRGTTAHSVIVDQTAQLPAFFQGSKWGVGFVLAVAAALIVHFYLKRTTLGYEQRISGEAMPFARYGGIPSARAVLTGMLISGALAGLAGAIEILGVYRRLMQGFSTGGGFDGLMVAILARNNPLAVVIVAIFFAGIRLGAQIGLQASMSIPRELGGGIIATIILFVAAENLFLEFLDSGRLKLRKAFGVKEGRAE
jgi:general nucleoside transport system permease protein